MRTVIVVVALELAQYGCSVSLVDDQKMVEQFAADRVGCQKSGLGR